MFQVNKKDTRTTPVASFYVFIVNLEHFAPCSSVSVVNFEQINAGWDDDTCFSSFQLPKAY